MRPRRGPKKQSTMNKFQLRVGKDKVVGPWLHFQEIPQPLQKGDLLSSHGRQRGIFPE